VVHSRDDKEVGVAHEVKSPDNQPQISQMAMRQYWLSPKILSDQHKMLAVEFDLFNRIFY